MINLDFKRLKERDFDFENVISNSSEWLNIYFQSLGLANEN